VLALDDLVDLGVTLRGAGYKVSPEQILSLQQLLLRLAAQGGLPERRAPLARWFAPLLCTNAGEQRGFDAVFAAWLRQRFADEPALPPPPPPPDVKRRAPAPWQAAAAALLAAALAAGGWYLWQQRQRDDGIAPVEPAASAASAVLPSLPSSAPVGTAPMQGLQALGQLDFSDAQQGGEHAAKPLDAAGEEEVLHCGIHARAAHDRRASETAVGDHQQLRVEADDQHDGGAVEVLGQVIGSAQAALAARPRLRRQPLELTALSAGIALPRP